MASVARTSRKTPPTEPTAKRAALYPRVSSRGQEEDGTSLTTQEQRCRAFAAV